MFVPHQPAPMSAVRQVFPASDRACTAGANSAAAPAAIDDATNSRRVIM
jgi:hypothetical protein